MTDEELIRQDLAERLGYDVKVSVDSEALGDFDSDWKEWDFSEPQTVDGVYKDGITFECLDFWDGYIPFRFVKPYLYPLSILSVEDLESMGVRTNLEISDISKGLLEGSSEFDLEDVNGLLHELRLRNIDYKGLIPRDLAIDARGLNIYEEEV